MLGTLDRLELVVLLVLLGVQQPVPVDWRPSHVTAAGAQRPDLPRRLGRTDLRPQFGPLSAPDPALSTATLLVPC
jgi:hypothetical protein